MLIGGFLIAILFVVIGVFVLGFANETLDIIAGLFGTHESETWTSPFPDYGIPGLEDNPIASLALGIGITGLILVLTFLIGWLVTRRKQKTS